MIESLPLFPHIGRTNQTVGIGSVQRVDTTDPELNYDVVSMAWKAYVTESRRALMHQRGSTPGVLAEMLTVTRYGAGTLVVDLSAVRIAIPLRRPGTPAIGAGRAFAQIRADHLLYAIMQFGYFQPGENTDPWDAADQGALWVIPTFVDEESRTTLGILQESAQYAVTLSHCPTSSQPRGIEANFEYNRLEGSGIPTNILTRVKSGSAELRHRAPSTGGVDSYSYDRLQAISTNPSATEAVCSASFDHWSTGRRSVARDCPTSQVAIDVGDHIASLFTAEQGPYIDVTNGIPSTNLTLARK